MRPLTFRLNQFIDRQVIAFSTFFPSAVLNWNIVILDDTQSQLCGSITLSKFGVDPIFVVGNIAIL